jgi:hypothetical protein
MAPNPFESTEDEPLTWNNLSDLSIRETDYDGHSQVSVDECPKCAAIVMTRIRTKHEAVCWNG